MISRLRTRLGRWQSKEAASAAQVALAWVLQAPGVTAPIVGATKTRQLTELIAAGGYQAYSG